MSGTGGEGLEVDLRVPGRVQVAVTAEAGEVVAVIGPNGAGKSSLVKALAGILPAHGSARLAGEELLDLPVRDRMVGMVFQGQLLFPHLSARDNVAFGPRSRGVTRRRAEASAREWLDRLGIGELADRRPRELSGGQAQRVAIARALATDPRLLLLDEPMTGLDVSVATALRSELARHLQDFPGVTLLVTHDAVDALTLADRVLVLDAGRAVQVGTAADVAQHPRTEHVARLVGLNVLREDDRLQVFSPTEVTVGLAEPVGSARLHWSGTVSGVTPHGAAVRVLVTTDSGPRLIAEVTGTSAAELGLAPGRRVWLSVKATAVRTAATR